MLNSNYPWKYLCRFSREIIHACLLISIVWNIGNEGFTGACNKQFRIFLRCQCGKGKRICACGCMCGCVNDFFQHWLAGSRPRGKNIYPHFITSGSDYWALLPSAASSHCLFSAYESACIPKEKKWSISLQTVHRHTTLWRHWTKNKIKTKTKQPLVSLQSSVSGFLERSLIFILASIVSFLMILGFLQAQLLTFNVTQLSCF